VTADQAPDPSELERLKALCTRCGIPPTLRRDIYQAVLDRVLDNRRVSDEEKARLAATRDVLSLEDAQVRPLHQELFTATAPSCSPTNAC